MNKHNLILGKPVKSEPVVNAYLDKISGSDTLYFTMHHSEDTASQHIAVLDLHRTRKPFLFIQNINCEWLCDYLGIKKHSSVNMVFSDREKRSPIMNSKSILEMIDLLTDISKLESLNEPVSDKRSQERADIIARSNAILSAMESEPSR